MSFNLSLAYLRGAIQEDLGDVASLIGTSFIDRAINEGQRRLEPDILLPVTTSITIPADTAQYDLPLDLVEITRFVRSPLGGASLPDYFQHGNTVYFNCPTSADWVGMLHYRAHFPAITESDDCQLPSGAADALISFGLYRSFRRLAANRAEYRKFATIVGNGVTMADLEATAEAHLQDFADAAASAAIVPPPITPYG